MDVIMALTQPQIDAINSQITALKKARASGALIVRHGETSVQYRSLSEIDQIIGTLEDSLNESTTKTRVRYPFQSGKGL